MNHTMGRYIAELDAEGRDRLVVAPDFSNGAWWDGSCGCLIGTAQDFGRFGLRGLQLHGRALRECEATGHPQRYGFQNGWGEKTAAYRYPETITRFGKARVVRAIKLRAARLNGTSPEQIAGLLNPAVRQGVGR